MFGVRCILVIGTVFLTAGCVDIGSSYSWQSAVNRQAAQLGYRNWIVVTEASFPAQNRPGISQVNASVEVPEALDYVLQVLEQTENLRPQVYQARELRSVGNDYAPGIDALRKRLKVSLHGHEVTELDQQSLLTLLEDVNRSYNVLVVRTQTALPYSTVFLELQPGYWDAASEAQLRQRIDDERLQKLVRPFP